MQNTINGIAVLLFAALVSVIVLDIMNSPKAEANVWVPPQEIAQPDLGSPEYNTEQVHTVEAPAAPVVPSFSAPDTSGLVSGIGGLAPDSLASSSEASTTEKIISLMQEIIRILTLLIQATAAQYAV